MFLESMAVSSFLLISSQASATSEGVFDAAETTGTAALEGGFYSTEAALPSNTRRVAEAVPMQVRL